MIFERKNKMREKKSIEEQVAELTEKQKDTVVKVGIWGTVTLCIIAVPALLWDFLGFVLMITSPLLMTEAAFSGWLIGLGIGMVLVALPLIIIKAVFPYYSDKKARYIMKLRKKEKKK